MGMGGMMGGFGSGWGGFGSGFGTFGLLAALLNLVITIAIIVGVVLLIAWLWRRVNADSQSTGTGSVRAGSQDLPRQILQARYARGEITREEYQQMLADLS